MLDYFEARRCGPKPLAPVQLRVHNHSLLCPQNLAGGSMHIANRWRMGG